MNIMQIPVSSFQRPLIKKYKVFLQTDFLWSNAAHWALALAILVSQLSLALSYPEQGDWPHKFLEHLFNIMLALLPTFREAPFRSVGAGKILYGVQEIGGRCGLRDHKQGLGEQSVSCQS
ncbi:hypothetical protein F4804DRAFT_333404 [Jackrogersella minutella]|nr:hypothetical protein F4804DRAFT_333404 [Jackrogersella minutella]